MGDADIPGDTTPVSPDAPHDDARADGAPRHEIDPKLLECLVCPVSHGPLEYDRARPALISRQARLVYPIRDGVPIMLESDAAPLED